MRLSEIQQNTVRVRRDGEFRNLGFLEDSQEGMFVFLEHARFLPALERNSSIAAVLTTPELAEAVPERVAVAVCGEPRVVFAHIHNFLAAAGFYWDEFDTVIDPQAAVHPTAWISPRNVRIGGNTTIGPQAAVLERCILGEGVEVGAGAVLGGAGFQTVRSARPMVEMRHAGGLAIGDGVRVLPGAVVATGVFRGNTEIAAEARIGARAFVSHAVQVGERTFVGHGAVINGNVSLGADVWIGPGAVIANNLTIGDRASVSLGAVVIRDVEAGARVSGNFAVSHLGLLRALAAMEPDAQAE